MPHLWIVLSLTSAFSLATSDALTKRIITPGNEHAIAWLRIFYSLPALSAAMTLTPLPSLDKTFFLAFCAALPLEVLAILLYYKALRVSPLSLWLPFLSFTPVFLLLFSRLIMGEAVSAAGAAGIALIALGGYGLNLSALREGPLGPLKARAAGAGVAVHAYRCHDLQRHPRMTKGLRPPLAEAREKKPLAVQRHARRLCWRSTMMSFARTRSTGIGF